MDNILCPFFLVLLFFGIGSSRAVTINVLDFGAINDSEIDNSQAFLEAWMEACYVNDKTSQIIVPEDMTFLVKSVEFKGPCRVKNINFVISGTIVAPSTPSDWDEDDASKWLVFENVSGLRVNGHGTIDGHGKGWWDQSCRYHPQLKGCTKLAPTALKFLGCNDSSLENIYFKNSPQTHVLIQKCNGFEVNKLIIKSPGNSPNTDGIHIHSSHNTLITNVKISSGDDCISVGDYVSNLEIVNVQCGPGHGISIGSLGKSKNIVQVENIHVSNVVLNRTTNGARIKTWMVGRGYVRGVTFENIKFISVKNPIIIDQNYCDVQGKCKEKRSGVHLSDIVYRDMYGTSNTKVAINLNCSRAIPCSGIEMENIRITSDKQGQEVTSDCKNAHGQEYDVVPGICLLNSGGDSKISPS